MDEISLLGQINITGHASLGLTVAPVTVVESQAHLSKTTIFCTQTIFAGDSVACSVMLRDKFGNPVGDMESLSAFSLSSTSDEIPRMQFKSTGNFLATIPGIFASGAYLLRVNFSGVPIDVEAANVTTIVSAASAVDESKSTISCPGNVKFGYSILCTITLRDRYGNKHSKASSAGSLHVRGVLLDGTSVVASIAYDAEKGMFVSNLTMSDLSTIKIGDTLEVHALVNHVRINSEIGNIRENADVELQASAMAAGAPVPSTSVEIVENKVESGPICVSLQQLVDSCVAQRGEWGFTCSSMRSWKRSGGCPDGNFMTPQGCQMSCPE